MIMSMSFVVVVDSSLLSDPESVGTALNAVVQAQPKDPFREMQQVLYLASLEAVTPPARPAMTEKSAEAVKWMAKYGA